jgi:hypothetical protein
VFLANLSFSGCFAEYAEQSGEIYSPNYPANYDNNMDCLVVIRAPPETVIHLQFIHMDIEDNEDCIYDWLRVKTLY